MEQEIIICKLNEVSLRDISQLEREGYDAIMNTKSNVLIAKRKL